MSESSPSITIGYRVEENISDTELSRNVCPLQFNNKKSGDEVCISPILNTLVEQLTQKQANQILSNLVSMEFQFIA